MLSPRRLVVVGSVIVDILLNVVRLPERGGDLLAAASHIDVGGGFNVLSAARRQDMPAALLGRCGSGPFGERVAEALTGEGVETLLPRESAADTGFCVGFVEPDGERTFVTSPGVESRLEPAVLAAAPIAPGDAVYVSGYDLCYPVSGPAIAGWLAALPESALLVVDPGPLIADIPPQVWRRVMERCNLLTLNAREAGLREPAAGLVVLRRGAAGCRLVMGDAVRDVPGFPVDPLDSTGAGDAHTGVLLAALATGATLPAAARRANAAAAITVTRTGGPTCPTAREIDAFLGE